MVKDLKEIMMQQFSYNDMGKRKIPKFHQQISVHLDAHYLMFLYINRQNAQYTTDADQFIDSAAEHFVSINGNIISTDQLIDI